MSQPADEPASSEDTAAEHLFSDDPEIDDAVWESLNSDITSEDW
ncbi:hypothetical protein ACXJJ3_42275 (plasmid) [Kribbella sp. WER1]